MGFIVKEIYDKKKNKLKTYFGILIHTKQIFNIYAQILKEMTYLYEDPNKKLQNVEKDLEFVSFLKDGQYRIMSDVISSYETYEEHRREDEMLK
jgi:hypothetical protein